MKRADPVPGSRLYVVRHADAGVRGDSADDHLRPLTPEGRDRAHALAELLEAGADGVIVSSPLLSSTSSARCPKGVSCAHTAT